MKYFLITESHNYADEFDFEAFMTAEAKSLEDLNTKIKRCLDEEFAGRRPSRRGIEIYFGTNEYITFESVDEMVSSLQIQEITQEEYGVLNTVLGGSFGMSVLLDRLYFDED